MKPALLWMEHVLGFEQIWEIAFHTNDVAAAQKRDHGSGLKSVVMCDPQSGIKFANNEPLRPFFKESQINIFAEENRGDGVQHSALAVTDILDAVRGLRARGVEFMPTPGSYYDMLPERLRTTGIGAIDESLRHPARARDPGRRREAAAVPAADLPQGGGRPVPRSGGGAVLLRDHPAQGRPGLRRRQLPRAVRGIERDQQAHRAPGAAAPSPPRM